ncbi:MAG: hypothetical protein IGS39_04730 [Calothrix sp. C42_A2020_038]|nr:hypothetical protein [Calothrix sp. C42_A2020_038]
MFKTLLVLIVGCLPSLFSLWIIRKAQFRMRVRIRQTANTFTSEQRIPQHSRPLDQDRYYLEGVGYLIGDISCQYNARSGYIRCAVNPTGPCEGCRFYQPREVSCKNKA